MIEAKVYQLPLYRPDKVYYAYLGILQSSFPALSAQAAHFLHPQEIQTVRGFPGENRKMSYLQGRYIAKRALSNLLGESDLCAIRIKSGVFGQPLVMYPGAEIPSVSISHTQSCACALAVSREHPMGLDVEKIAPENNEAIRSQLTALEIQLQYGVAEAETTFFTRLWTIKEALSKVIQTGLMTPLEVYQVAEIKKHPYHTESTFTNFAQYKAISFEYGENICSIVLPKNTDCRLPLPLR